MKNIGLILVLVIFTVQSFAQQVQRTAHFIYSNDQIKECQILDRDGSVLSKSDENGILDYTKEISHIKFTEDPPLNSQVNHYFKIGGSEMKFTDDKNYINGKNHLTGDLVKPITFQPGDEIILMREKAIVGIIKIKKKTIAKDSVISKISVNDVGDNKLKSFTFKNDSSQIFKVKIENKLGVDIEKIRIKYNDHEKNVTANQESIVSFEINPMDIKNVSEAKVEFIFNVKGYDDLGDFSIEIGTVSLEPFFKLGWWEIIIIVVAALIIVILIAFGLRKYCSVEHPSKQHSIRLTDVHKKRIKIKTSGEFPQINDKASPNGVYEMEDGHIYEISEGKLKSIQFKLRVQDTNETVMITLKSAELQVGDSASKNGTFKTSEGTTYIISNNIIESIIKKPTIEELEAELVDAQERISELEKRPTADIYKQLLENFESVKAKLEKANTKLGNVAAVEDKVRIDERQKVESKHRRDINANYVTIISYKKELKKVETQKKEAVEAKDKAEKSLKIKESILLEKESKIKDQLELIKTQKEEIIRQSAFVATLKKTVEKKNIYYLFEVEDALSDISSSFKDVYNGMTNDALKDGLINPMLRGVSGLSAGILSWKEDFTVKIKEDSESFFGQEYLTMNQEDVKEILAKKFISNIVKSDSFSKFVRLYQLSMVPCIRKQFIEANMNLDILNKLYYKMYTLVTDFGYTIICPVLFEEQYDDQKYQWFNSTNLYNLLVFTEEDKAAIKAKGAETIIDVNQIGFTSPWASRKATTVTPDF